MNPKATSYPVKERAKLGPMAWAVSLTAIYSCGQVLAACILPQEAGFEVFLDMMATNVCLQ